MTTLNTLLHDTCQFNVVAFVPTGRNDARRCSLIISFSSRNEGD